MPGNIHKIAAFLWPEFKQLRYLNEVTKSEVISLIKEEMVHVDYHVPKPEPILNNSLGDILEDLEQYKDVVENPQANYIERELSLYQSSVFTEGSILNWWATHQMEFPILQSIAKKILCIPASSASSERCFSTANRILEERRSNLKSENVDALLFLHSSNNTKT